MAGLHPPLEGLEALSDPSRMDLLHLDYQAAKAVA